MYLLVKKFKIYILIGRTILITLINLIILIIYLDKSLQ